MSRTFRRADGSSFTPEDPDPDALAATLYADIQNGRIAGPRLLAALANLRYAERVWAARSIHEIDQYQAGGSHPNTFDLRGCGICSRLLEG